MHDLEKRRMYIRFKQFLFQSRILTFQSEEFDRLLRQVQALPFKEIHLTEKWDETYLKQQHPELHRSVLYHISKAVGRKTFAPPEIAKSYLSNPELARSLTHYTFDLNELKALRRDVLLNPEKYAQILEQPAGHLGFKDRFQIHETKDQEWEYWYRVLNDGKAPVDGQKHYQTLLAYKEFVEGVEKKAVGTLKLIVQRLINDFDHEAGVNEVQDFTHQQKETKREALAKLLALMGGHKDLKERKGRAKTSKVQNKLLAESRPLSEIKRHINNLLMNDPQIKELIPDENLD